MSILGSIMSKVFHRGGDKAAAQPAPAPRPAAPAPAPAPQAAPTPTVAPEPYHMDQVDVEAVLSTMAADNGQNLDWRHSIVDLLKLLSIDSSLAARKELAGELGYTGDTSDSASMNIWLHKQVMNKLAANGGKVPADLRD